MRRSADEVIRVEDDYYILATSARVDDVTRVLKNGDTFGVFDRHGDVQPLGLGEQGLYHEGTRHLSDLELRVFGRRPLLLGSTVREDNAVLAVDLTNPDASRDGEVVLPRGTVHLLRTKLLWDRACHERVRVTSYATEPVEVALSWRFDADFADVFEVRGVRRERRGRRLEPEVGAARVVLAYEGLDGVVRRSVVELDPPPDALSPREARYALRLPPRGEALLHLWVGAEAGAPAVAARFEDAAARAGQAMEQAAAGECAVRASNEAFQRWVDQSVHDLRMMTTTTRHGPYPYAGVPWYCTPFGRDGILTALGWLWAKPSVARGVLRYLAATQARETDDARDAQPGKILHEARGGEMAALGEVPFGRYYGSVDATSLFVLLAAAYHRRTGDDETARDLWPHVEAALAWHEGPGDPDRDGFVEYATHTPKGLVNQGWKDSRDAVFHADGTLVEGPVALCEVQAYLHAALRGASGLARALGHGERAAAWGARAERLRERFEAAFWDDELGTYVLALDGRKRPCRVRTSNAGQCLFGGIASARRARRVARSLLSEDAFSGWGVRTVAAGEARYNAMSYHNGSVWPHDGALVALGMARYGLQAEALAVLDGLFDASTFFDLHRLPELFCGFPRRRGQGPTAYPVACAPQSWAAASVFLLLEACLGLSVDAARGRVRFRRPTLPSRVRELSLSGLEVGDASIDLVVRRHAHDVGVDVDRRSGRVRVEVLK